MLENPIRESRSKQQRDEKRAKQAAENAKKKSGIMGRKEASEKGIWKLEKGQTRYVTRPYISSYFEIFHLDLTCFCHYIVFGLATCLNSLVFHHPRHHLRLLSYRRCL
jgi:hypothetical protein